ncbi:tetratricopeptide repeat protein [Echinicola arenosa]|uniref:tetratricopeptide repeat protein n=1 Tax=Echinicola arenosa TaxID=2774144 RepID=UPI001CDD0FC9|nr:hypothetical protein [Echinicola arenosa]
MKKAIRMFLVMALGLVCTVSIKAQTFTMGKKCSALLEEANTLLNSQSYSEALAKLDEFSGNCKTKDAKELGSISKAEAYNALGQYDRAIKEADAALKVSKNKSLGGHFQKGIALQGLGDISGSKAELDKVIELTEMNQNTKERANNYALMARIYNRQLNEQDTALMYLDKAIEMDPENTSFLLQKGDMALFHNQYLDAYDAYDQALENGHDPLEVYISRSNVGLKMVENKYGTNKAQELKKSMTAEEKNTLCSDIGKALELGWVNMSMDMFSALVCN